MLSKFSPTFARLAVVAALAQYAAAATDYLIVGGGTAGLVLANRLTEDPSVSVMVLEAGGDGLGNVNISDISLIGAAWGTDIDWQFPTQPLYYANDRQLTPSPRGKVLGGSSAINGDVYERGDQLEYDQWETLGNTGWNFNSLFNVSKGLNEAFSPPTSSENIEYVLGDHGLSGLLPTSFSSSAPDFHNTIMQAVVNAGGYLSPDQAGGNVTGIAHVTNARLASNNTRATSTDFPYSYRSNLQVTLNATVTKINWASVGRLTGGNAIASGVEYVDGNGDTQTANATTVILSGGPWGSPPILERSGIGNATYLTSLGIDSVVDLPGVGENMNEQTLVAMQWQLNASIPCPGDPFLLNVESLQTTLGAGNLSTLESLLDATPENLQPALWDMHKRLYAEAAPWIEGYIYLNTPDSGPSTLTWYPVNLHPLSRGSVHIVSSDGLEYPEIQYNFFQNPVDLYIMAAGAQRVQEIISTAPISGFIAGEPYIRTPMVSTHLELAPLAPAAGVTSIDDLSEYIKAEASYTNHVMGSALLAPQADGGVVDPTLKVYGTSNVYVVDASIIPLQPAAHSQATVYAVAEYAAQLFKQ
ncbi:hypothetical protein H0H92_002182 [Tricholoma furcatifolium]|nr:hypothetical protein H0H92_002182 [Tricholoma furcatifolium]